MCLRCFVSNLRSQLVNSLVVILWNLVTVERTNPQDQGASFPEVWKMQNIPKTSWLSDKREWRSRFFDNFLQWIAKALYTAHTEIGMNLHFEAVANSGATVRALRLSFIFYNHVCGKESRGYRAQFEREGKKERENEQKRRKKKIFSILSVFHRNILIIRAWNAFVLNRRKLLVSNLP